MLIKPKPLYQQVFFITQATSRIGLATVRLAIDQGAKVFMVDRNEDELQIIQDEMRLKNFPTAYAVADVAEIDQVQIAADHCLVTFGRIDTWVNTSESKLYGRLLETDETDAKRLFDTNFWGVVNGCKVAVPLLTKNGGTIINVACDSSQESLPIQGIYLASQQAVKCYTDALRKELSALKVPVSIKFINSGTINAVAKMTLKNAVGSLREMGKWNLRKRFFSRSTKSSHKEHTI